MNLPFLDIKGADVFEPVDVFTRKYLALVKRSGHFTQNQTPDGREEFTKLHCDGRETGARGS